MARHPGEHEGGSAGVSGAASRRLLGIEHAGQLATHPLRGSLFENLVITDVLKHRTNTGRTSNLHFYRDSSGLEVDLVYESAGAYLPIEIKAGQTLSSTHFDALKRFIRLLPRTASPLLVHGGEDDEIRNGMRALPATKLVPALREHESLLS